MDIILYCARCPEGGEHDAAYRLLSLVLERELGQSMPEIAREPGGKPYFPSRPDVCFNLSHSHGAVVCAVHDKPIGVDVEKLRPAPRRLAGGMEDAAFFRFWTAKEATIKRLGLGIAALRKPLEPDARCRSLDGLLDGWIVTVCPTEDHGVRAVCLGETSRRINFPPQTASEFAPSPPG